MNNIFKNKKILIPVIAIVIAFVAYLGISFSVPLENDVEVTPNSDLTYYLNVYYDGVDRNGVKSNDTTVSNINSGYMYITDKLPDGLTFQGFVTTTDGTIGAVRRDDENTSCLGKVVDDTNEDGVDSGVWDDGHTEYTYHGLHYNESDRTITFKVKNLQAGCKLTVGIVTKTPATIDDPLTEVIEKRRDFYNFGQIREDSLTVISNTVHVFMGKGDLPMYTVTYQYTGTVPSNAPAVPLQTSFIEGSKVAVSAPVDVEGYTFSGWSTSDVTINDGSFIMPSSNVTLIGSFSQVSKYNVTYQINGTRPNGYSSPNAKSYYPKSTVRVDSLSEGDIINGYRFSGWSTSDVTVSNENDFTMPNDNVQLRGEFREVTYTVTYAFYDTVLPPNSDSLLPEPASYKPGVRVTHPTITEPSGYKFLGWYKEDNFVMPEENITIYGEWMRQTGTFEPTITKTINEPNRYYEPGNQIFYEIVVTNTASFPIHDIVIKESNNDARFFQSDNYVILSDHYVKIPSLAAGASTIIRARYYVKETDNNRVINEVEIVGALADNDYVLKEKEYKASAVANLASKLTICKNISGPSVPNKFQFHVTGTNYETWVVLAKDECNSFYVSPGTYQIKEIIPQEYEISSISGLTSNGSNLQIDQGNDYTVTFTNRFIKKGFYHSFGRIENTLIIDN